MSSVWNRKSIIWDYFTKCSINEKTTCIICCKRFTYRRCTRKLRIHLLTEHPLVIIGTNKRKKVEKNTSGNSNGLDCCNITFPEVTLQKHEDAPQTKVILENSSPLNVLHSTIDGNHSTPESIIEETTPLKLLHHEKFEEKTSQTVIINPKTHLIKLVESGGGEKQMLTKMFSKEAPPLIPLDGKTKNSQTPPIVISNQAPPLRLLKGKTMTKSPPATNTVDDIPPLAPLEHVTGANNQIDIENSKETSKLMEMIIRDLHPVSMVENEGFLEFIQCLQPLYKPPCKELISEKILPNVYMKAVRELETIIDEIDSCSLSLDIWTSDNNLNYLTVKVHFIHSDTSHARVLATEEIPKHHTLKNIVMPIVRILKDWNIWDKITSIVSADNLNSLEMIKEYIGSNHTPCFAHVVNLCIIDALQKNENLKALLEKCRDLVVYVKFNGKVGDDLKELREEMGHQVLSVKQDVDTSWKSSYAMIQRLVLVKDPLCIGLANPYDAPECPNDEDWKVLDDFLRILKPLNLLTDSLCGEKYHPSSIILPLTQGLQFHLSKYIPVTTVGAQLKFDIVTNITKRLCGYETSEIVAKACFLDPRFKKMGFGLEANAKKAQDLITEEIKQLFASQSQSVINLIDDDEESDENPLAVSEKDVDMLWNHFDGKSKSSSVFTPSAIKRYLNLSLLDRKSDPLQFWAKNKSKFPELYKLAMKYLCVPATSVPAKVLFTEYGDLMKSKWSQLEPDNLNHILFLNSMY